MPNTSPSGETKGLLKSYQSLTPKTVYFHDGAAGDSTSLSFSLRFRVTSAVAFSSLAESIKKGRPENGTPFSVCPWLRRPVKT